MAVHDHYDVLEVSPRAGQDVIDAAYRALMRRLSQTSDDPTAGRQRELVEAAYTALGSPAARHVYDNARLVAGYRRGAAVSRSELSALGNPFVTFLRMQGRDLLILMVGTFGFLLLLDFVYGGLDSWHSVKDPVLPVLIITSATAVLQFCMVWRPGIPAILGLCAGWTTAVLAMLTVAHLGLPSPRDFLATGIGGGVLFVLALWLSTHE